MSYGKLLKSQPKLIVAELNSLSKLPPEEEAPWPPFFFREGTKKGFTLPPPPSSRLGHSTRPHFAFVTDRYYQG